MLNKEVVPSSPPPPQKKPRASRKGAQVVTPSKKVSVSLERNIFGEKLAYSFILLPIPTPFPLRPRASKTRKQVPHRVPSLLNKNRRRARRIMWCTSGTFH